MKTFKDVVARDIHAVFLNPEELAELRTVRYAGEVYIDIPVSLQELGTEERTRLRASGFGRGGPGGARGLYRIKGVLFCAAGDLGGHVPKQGNELQINTRQGGTFFKTYRAGLVGNEMGMLRIELEGTDE